MSERVIYTKRELLGLLVALYMAGVQSLALRIVSAALGIDWVEVMVGAERMIEAGADR